MRNGRPVLLVDDDAVDTMTVKRAFKDLRITNALLTKPNGEEALEYLHDDDSELPCLILLDVNMPKMNGIEFLRQLRDDGSLRRIPVVMLTTSRDDYDKLSSFQLSAQGYVVKPVDYVKFVEAIRLVHLYWTLSELPSGSQLSEPAGRMASSAL